MTELDPRLIGETATAVASVESDDELHINRAGVTYSTTIAAVSAFLGGGMTISSIITGIDAALGGTSWQQGGSAAAWGSINGTLADQTDLVAALAGKLSTSGGTLSGALIATSFSVATDNAFAVVGDAVRMTYDSNDYAEYDKVNNVFNFGIGGTVKLTISASTIDAKSLRIVNVAAPTGDNDAVSRSYVLGLLDGITPGAGEGLPAGSKVGGVQFYKSPGVFGQDSTFFVDEDTHVVQATQYSNAIDKGGADVVTVSGTYSPTLAAQTIRRNVTGASFILGLPTYSPPADVFLSFQLILTNIDSEVRTFTAPAYGVHGYSAPALLLLPNIPTEFWILHYDGVWRIAGRPMVEKAIELWYPGTPPVETSLLRQFTFVPRRVPMNYNNMGIAYCETAPTATTIITIRRRVAQSSPVDHLRATFNAGSQWGVWSAYVSGQWTTMSEAGSVVYQPTDMFIIDPPTSWNGLKGLLLSLLCGE